ncbi:MAG: hypothetical protein SFZ23_09620 [Planctomycetota bacterium]|nr:hypothetical protein [Planctomycetota bacterium]
MDATLSSFRTLRPKAIYAMAIATAIVLGGAAVLQIVGRQNSSTRAQAESSSQAKRLYDAVPLRPVSDISPESVVPPTLSGPNLDALPRGARDALFRDLGQFLYLRFGSAEPDAYAKWRSQRGDTPRPLVEINRFGDVGEDYQFFFGEALPPTMTFDQLFTALRKAGDDYASGVNRATDIAGDPRGFAIAITRWTPDHRVRARLDAPGTPRFWNTSVSAAMRRFWTAPASSDVVLARDGELWWMDFGFLLRYDDGSRRPMLLGGFYDPGTESWRFEQFHAMLWSRSEFVTALAY